MGFRTWSIGGTVNTASGGVVSVVTKSGGNAFHGSAKVLATNDQLLG